MSLGLHNFNFCYVYRVLRPDEDPYTHLTCKDPNSRRTLGQHIETGLWIPSRYISTTASLEKAIRWLEVADRNTSWQYGNARNIIVKVDIEVIKSRYSYISDSAFDLTNWVNREHLLDNDTQRRIACAYQEIVFQDYIPSEVVRVEYTSDRGYFGYQMHYTSHVYPTRYQPTYGTVVYRNTINEDSIQMRTWGNRTEWTNISRQITNTPKSGPECCATCCYCCCLFLIWIIFILPAVYREVTKQLQF